MRVERIVTNAVTPLAPQMEGYVQQLFDVAAAASGAGGAGGAGSAGQGGGGGAPWPELPEELRGQPAAEALLTDALKKTLEARRGAFVSSREMAALAHVSGVSPLPHMCGLTPSAPPPRIPAGAGSAPRPRAAQPGHGARDAFEARGVLPAPPASLLACSRLRACAGGMLCVPRAWLG